MDILEEVHELAAMGFEVFFSITNESKGVNRAQVQMGLVPRLTYRGRVRFRESLVFTESHETPGEALSAAVAFARGKAAALGITAVEPLVGPSYDPSLWEPGYPGFPRGSVIRDAVCEWGGVRTRIYMLPVGTVFKVHNGAWVGSVQRDEDGIVYMKTGSDPERDHRYITDRYTADITVLEWGRAE